MWDALWINANLATMTDAGGVVRDGALAVAEGQITFVGARADLPGLPGSLAATVHDANGAWITPGLIDCHTHIVYGGNRADEFEMRLEGASYEDIAKAGGGIVSTVKATRAASEGALYDDAARRLSRLMAEGVTTIEIKSGYGLETESELKMLTVARALGARLPITVMTSFLGAHALPPEYAGRSGDYISYLCDETMPAAAARGLADAVDGFCETIGFSAGEIERVFDRAQQLGLPVKLHAEQLSDQGGAALVARFGGLSADHLEYVQEKGVKAMAKAGTVAVLLPGAFYFLRETKVPPIDLFRRHNVPIALATDSNPGSSPAVSLLLMLNMACTLFRLTPGEALAGVTRNAARALGVEATAGTLAVGKRADFVAWDIATPAELAYAIGANPAVAVVQDGAIVYTA